MAITGGLDVRAAGFRIRAHDAVRSLVAAASLIAVYTALEWRNARRDPASAGAAVAPWLAVSLAAVTTIDALHFGSFIAGGADSYGYVSQAYGWASGHLPRPYPILLTLPSAGDAIQAPLGYWPGPTPHTIVPTYSPGLPLLMAIGIRIADPIGPYLVVPLSAGLFVWATFVLARRLAGPAGGLAAATIAATSPIVLFVSLWPMSDVPSAALWTAAAAATLAGSRRGVLAAGMFAGAGVLMRPNLVPLTLVPLGWLLLNSRGAERLRRAALFSAPVVAVAICVGALNAAWYGSPLRSGYGRLGDLYSVSYVAGNLQRYLRWLWESQSPWILTAGVSLAVLARPSAARAQVALAWTLFLATFACYLSYFQYEQWWFLRFLLPGLGALFALFAVGLTVIARSLPRPWGAIAALAILVLAAGHSIRYVAALDIFGPFKAVERRHADIGSFIAERMPPDAVFFTMQYSGTIRFYGGRYTLRYELLSRGQANRVARDLERQGLHPYLAIDDGERAAVRAPFGLSEEEPLPWPEVARMEVHGGFSIYDLATGAASAHTSPIDTGLAPAYAAPREVVIQPVR